METIKAKLEAIANEDTYTDSIRKEVVQEALEYDEPKEFFSILSRYGCVSGHVSKLVWYNQTHAFFNRYYDDIENLRYQYEDMLGEPLKPKGDLMNWFAWFAFEETARQIANELELEDSVNSK